MRYNRRMSQLTIELTDELDAFVREQAASRNGASPADYVQRLIEQERLDAEDLADSVRQIQAALDDPRPPIPADEAFDQIAAKYGLKPPSRLRKSAAEASK